MATLQKWSFLSGAVAPASGDPLTLSAEKAGKQMAFQIYGTATSIAGKFLAKVFAEGDWIEVMAINATTLAPSVSYAAEGIYILDINGYAAVNVTATTLSGGNLTIKAKVY